MNALMRDKRLLVSVVTVVLVAIVTAVLAAISWFCLADFDKRLLTTAAVFAGGTSALAALAGALSLVALAQSLRRPELTLGFSLFGVGIVGNFLRQANPLIVYAREATPVRWPGRALESCLDVAGWQP